MAHVQLEPGLDDETDDADVRFIPQSIRPERDYHGASTWLLGGGTKGEKSRGSIKYTRLKDELDKTEKRLHFKQNTPDPSPECSVTSSETSFASDSTNKIISNISFVQHRDATRRCESDSAMLNDIRKSIVCILDCDEADDLMQQFDDLTLTYNGSEKDILRVYREELEIYRESALIKEKSRRHVRQGCFVSFIIFKFVFLLVALYWLGYGNQNFKLAKLPGVDVCIERNNIASNMNLMKTIIEDFCIEEKIAQPHNLVTCQRMCAGHMCCFSNATDDTCATKGECEFYSSCRVLLSTDNNINNVTETCSKNRISSNSGYSSCQRVCSQRACCFMAGACRCTPSAIKWCDEYKECQNLINVQPQSDAIG